MPKSVQETKSDLFFADQELEAENTMLVLTRKVGEAITIGGDITIRVLKVNGNQVRIGIIADESTEVVRKELHPVGKGIGHSDSSTQKHVWEGEVRRYLARPRHNKVRSH